MRRTRLSGIERHGDHPSWDPLLRLAPEHIEEFMWMFEVRLEDGTELHAYKHWWTRRYLHLSTDGRAFVYCSDGRYEEAAAPQLLREALA